MFHYGELRLLLLALIAERPCHGYELIRMVEERFGGSYTPSPGVIYPTLAWLEDSSYAASSRDGGRNLYTITPEGEAFLAQSRGAVDELLARSAGGERGPDGVPAPVVRAMQNLKLAMRLRMRRAFEGDAAEKIAAALDEAARTIENL